MFRRFDFFGAALLVCGRDPYYIRFFTGVA